MRRAARLSQDMSLGISEYLIFVHGNDAFAALGPTTDIDSPTILQWSTQDIVMRVIQDGAMVKWYSWVIQSTISNTIRMQERQQ